ncbi:MAG TPA: hypothetical protein VKP65_05810, partial [Rhodothermales bacterium]|nr:hypothetical protein [Rhodothermales bacterium]
MLMQHSSELVATSAVFHEQLQALGVPTEFSYVWLPDEAAGKHQFWATWTEDEDGAPVHRSKAITYDLDKEEPYTAACFAAWASDDPIHVDFISPADVEHFFATWEELLREAEHLRSGRFPDGIYYAEGYMQYGCFGINIRREPTEFERDILRRFAVEFERAYTRFLDLRRAEAQAREAQIEAALERVRSRTMAMHHSDEIAEVASVTFEQFQGLAFPSIRRISIGVMDTEANTMSFWASATTEGGSIRRVMVPMEENAVIREVVAGWRAGKSHFSLSCEGNTLQEFVAHITQHGWGYPAGEQMPKRLLMNFVSYRYGVINASTYEPIGEDEYVILQRFARVFEQTYTRFLDLKQAEANAREAEIEVALERVRARAMAMHSSDELLEVIFKIHQEYSGLGLPCGAFWHTRYTPESYHKALTGIDGQKLAAIMELPRDFASNPALAAWERGDEKIGVFMFDADAACQYLHHMVTKGKFHEVDPEAITEEMIRENDGWTFVQARTSHGEIGYSLWGETEPSQEAKDVLVRFAKTFDLAYQRYVDIAQAEARAREAEIEAALERLRARTMAMQSSDDLSDVIGRIFSELTHLDLVLTRCIIWVIDPGTRSARIWMANAERRDEPDSYFIPYHDHPSYDAFLSAWDRQETLWVYDLHGDLKTTWDEVLFTETELVRLPDDVKAGMAAPDRVLLTASFTNFGALHAASLEPLSDESTAILRRVAKVFDQTYTRYLDLEQAEAQAREAQIEASLERVRARAMGMHSSDDLSDATAIVFAELERLGIVTLRCGIIIIRETRHMDTWTATATSEGKDVRIVGRIDTTIHPLLEGVLEAWKAQQPYYVYELVGEDMQAYYQAIARETAYPLPEQRQPSQRQFCYTFFFPEGALFAFIEHPLPEESIQIFNRFAAVFALTYRRYLDLKKAEEQAREAQIEAALERVRSRTMAMQKSEELSETASVLFHQIKNLGFETWSCGFCT